LLALHGHLSDSGEFDRMDEVFADDVVHNLESFGAGTVAGRDALREMAIALGDRNPVGHHVTNIVVTPVDVDVAHVRSKGIGIMADGTCGSVVYDDVVHRTPAGWRIVNRRITARRTPLVP
jgi:hypothetical protein